jgi:alpha-L-fucosidase
VTALSLIVSGCDAPRAAVADNGSASHGTGMEQPTSPRMQWFNDAKFGLFIHWGLYAVPSGVWQGKPQQHSYAEHIMRTEKIALADYEALAAQFNPTAYDPEAIAEYALRAGMKYLVITAKHHDGFAMYHAKSDPYNIVDATPYGKDTLKPLFDAFRDRGLKVGFYYSQAMDWHEPDAAGNDWAFDNPNGKARSEEEMGRYIDAKVLPQLGELLSDYGTIDLIWFDTPNSITEPLAERIHAHVTALQPNCLISGRLIDHRRTERYHGFVDYQSLGDNANITSKQGFPWESCMTMNHSWGYKIGDDQWKPQRAFTTALATTAANGGTLLLNIGPKGDGSVPAPSVEIFDGLAEWYAVNGEAVYQTTPSPWDSYQPWGYATQKPGQLFCHVLDWQDGGSFALDPMPATVRAVRVLGGGLQAESRQDGERVVVTMRGAHDNGQPHPVVVVEHDGGVLDVPLVPVAVAGSAVELPLVAAQVSGDGKTVHGRDWQDQALALHMRTSSQSNPAAWAVDVAAPGSYRLVLNVRVGHKDLDPDVHLVARVNGAQQADYHLPVNDAPKQIELGPITFDRAGSHELSLSVINRKAKIQWKAVFVRGARLEPLAK